MGNDANIKRYSADERNAMLGRGESRTEWARVDAMTETELERSIAADPDWKDVPEDWHKHALPVVPGLKKLISLRIDADIIEWFRAQGPGYQTWMNAVLRAYVLALQKENRSAASKET